MTDERTILPGDGGADRNVVSFGGAAVNAPSLAVGAEVAAALYGRHCVVACVDEQSLTQLRAAQHLHISPDGALTIR